MSDQLITIPQPIQDKMIEGNAHTYTCIKNMMWTCNSSTQTVWTCTFLRPCCGVHIHFTERNLSLWCNIDTFSGILGTLHLHHGYCCGFIFNQEMVSIPAWRLVILDVFIPSRLTIVFNPQILYDTNLTYENGRHHKCNALSLFCQLQCGEDIYICTCVDIQIQSNNDIIHKNINHYIIFETENYLVVQFSLSFGAVFI